MHEDVFETDVAFELDGTAHTFALILQRISGAAPYRVKLDDQFFCTAESIRDARREITDFIISSDWVRTDPFDELFRG